VVFQLEVDELLLNFVHRGHPFADDSGVFAGEHLHKFNLHIWHLQVDAGQLEVGFLLAFPIYLSHELVEIDFEFAVAFLEVVHPAFYQFV